MSEGDTKDPTWLLARFEQAAATKLPARVKADYDIVCSQCGSPHWIDTVIPSAVWNQIADPSDILCMLCIDDRLFAKGLSAQARFYFSGQALVSELYAGDAETPREKRLAKLLAKYGEHTDTCAVAASTPDEDCTCGLEMALAYAVKD